MAAAYAGKELQKDVLDLCRRYFDEILQVLMLKTQPKQQVEQEQDVDRINDWFWNPV